jgi:hypothetical protein
MKLDSHTPEALVKYARCIKSIIRDYSQRFGDPRYYVESALPKVLGIVGSIEEIFRLHF